MHFLHISYIIFAFFTHFLSNIYMHFLHFEFLSKKQLQKCEKQTLALVNLTMELQLSSAQTLLDFTKAKSEKKIVDRLR